MILFLKKNKSLLFVLIDVLVISICSFVSMIFLGQKITFTNEFIVQLLLLVIIYEMYLNIFRLYQNMIRYEIGMDYVKYVLCALLTIITISIINLISGNLGGYYRVNVLTCIASSGIMVIYRLMIRSLINNKNIIDNAKNYNSKKVNNLLIIGAGMNAREIILTIKNFMPERYNIIGLIDDDLTKINHKISGVKVLGTRYDIPSLVIKNDIDLIFFAINRIDAINRRKILEICQETNVKTRILPTTEKMIDEQGAMNSLRDVEIEDLLGREAINFNDKNVKNIIKNKVVLVTGGGGSIGSELCRQIIQYNPSQLIIFDVYENNLYDIEMELRNEYGKLDLEAIVGSVRDKKRLENVFKTYSPDIVFHAAAHKHVPLMEHSPLEAIKNNVFGTYNVVNCADKYNVDKFVLISTDKAVNPTNVMGASKRLCEMIVQTKNQKSKTDFVAVRFGNVLGSNGSVIPLFKKQIAKGGPVTVTHKEITRFFMTIPEAVQLILQALTYANGGEIFVLDMGEPMKIYDLAVSLIKLMGYEPNVDIDINVTGLRPGEKLYEELLMAEEGLTSTRHNKIFISNPLDIDAKLLEKNLDELKKLEYDDNFKTDKVIKLMKKIVPTFKDSTEVNKIKESKGD